MEAVCTLSEFTTTGTVVRHGMCRVKTVKDCVCMCELQTYL